MSAAYWYGTPRVDGPAGWHVASNKHWLIFWEPTHSMNERVYAIRVPRVAGVHKWEVMNHWEEIHACAYATMEEARDAVMRLVSGDRFSAE